MFKGINRANESSLLSSITNAMEAIHRLRVLHCDAMPQSIMWDEKSEEVQIVDFERSMIHEKEEMMMKKRTS